MQSDLEPSSLEGAGDGGSRESLGREGTECYVW